MPPSPSPPPPSPSPPPSPTSPPPPSLAAGIHTLGGREFTVRSLPATLPAPVMIVLHGAGGIPEDEMNGVVEMGAAFVSTHIILAPKGGAGWSWNIKGEMSKTNDQYFVGTTLVDHLASHANVLPNFTLYGVSNGAALANRILIENDDPRITTAITDGSQLITLQYRPSQNGSFYVGGPNNAYTTVKTSLTSRRVLQIVGAQDGLFPAAGGLSGISDGEGGFLTTVNWEDSALAFAAAYGYSGAKAALSPDDASMAKVSYLGGQVVHVNFKQGGHISCGEHGDSKCKDVINDFMGAPPSPSSSCASPAAASSRYECFCTSVGAYSASALYDGGSTCDTVLDRHKADNCPSCATCASLNNGHSNATFLQQIQSDCCIANSPAGGPLTAGVHVLNGRNFTVHTLPAVTPAPVLLVLHGNGGIAANEINYIVNGASSAAAFVQTHIIVAPSGPMWSWNIKAESSQEDDQFYVGTTLVNHLAAFTNVQPEFKLYGVSNGAALTNRIFIENDDPRITTGITDGSHLNTLQYNGGSFYVGGPCNAYTVAKAPLAGRRLLQVTGALDSIAPPQGGPGTIPNGTGGFISWVHWEDSVLAYAKANGYTGTRAALLQNDTLLEKVSYLGGQVMSVNYKQGEHVVCADPPGCTDILDEFMGGGSPRSPPPPPAPSSPPPLSPDPNACASGGALTAGNCTLGGRHFLVQSIPATTPAPVMIVLHGAGQTADGEMQAVVNRVGAAFLQTHILVAPSGTRWEWNIKGEQLPGSQTDDQHYVGTTVINHLATFSNVQPVFKLYGVSNGAALTNRIFIENDDARITTGIIDGSQSSTRSSTTVAHSTSVGRVTRTRLSSLR